VQNAGHVVIKKKAILRGARMNGKEEKKEEYYKGKEVKGKTEKKEEYYKGEEWKARSSPRGARAHARSLLVSFVQTSRNEVWLAGSSLGQNTPVRWALLGRRLLISSRAECMEVVLV
jgi:hypothetical protein